MTVQLAYQDALQFLGYIYPNKKWQFKGLEGNKFVFETLEYIEKDKNYEQIHIVSKTNRWEIVINEDNEYSSAYKQPYDLATDLEKFKDGKVGVLNSVGEDQYSYRYNGSKSQQYIKKIVNKEQHFLQVVKDGLDSSLPFGNRSTYQLSKGIDFYKVALECEIEHENFFLNYCSYIDHRICVLLDQTACDCISKMIINKDFDDSLADMLEVLKKIKEANKKAGYEVTINPKIISNIKKNSNDFKAEIKHQQLTTQQKKQISSVFKSLIAELT